MRHLASLLLLPAVAVAVSVPAQAAERRRGPNEPPDACPQAYVEGIGPAPYLNGLPILQRTLEIVGDRVKVMIATTPRCDVVTPSGLPYRWHLTGPAGDVALPTGTLRPSFTPDRAGSYEASLTYCPNGCSNRTVGHDVVDIPASTVSLRFDVVDHMVLPPSTRPVVIPKALWPSDRPLDDKRERQKKCGWPNVYLSQLVPVTPWVDASSYALLEGTVTRSGIAGHDYEFNHDSHDIGMDVVPDPQYEKLMVKGAREMEVEWEESTLPPEMRPMADDRISVFGFHTYDCHHSEEVGILTEIHPPVLTAVHRVRPIEIPDGWGPPGRGSLGSDIFVPGVITDIWANRRNGEMTRCSTTALHQAATPPLVQQGACIESPHPIRRRYTFNIYLPENPQKRMAALGVTAPPAPLYLEVQPPDPSLTVVLRTDDGQQVPTPQTDDDVSYLEVTFDLPAYVEVYGTYARRIVAAWVLPSEDNWGLERWQAGISSIEVLDKHEFDYGFPPVPNPGKWVFRASLNNRDREWIEIFNRGPVRLGLHDFEPDWQTEQGDSHGRHSLGPHLLLFNPGPARRFPGLPQQDPTQSARVAASGYEDEYALSDDPTGAVQEILHLGALGAAIGQRVPVTRTSSMGDYKLNLFFERLGPVAPARLDPAGRALVDAYTIRGNGARCTRVSPSLCVVLPENVRDAAVWHPLLAPAPTGVRRAPLAWHDHPLYKPQEDEPVNVAELPFDVLERELVEMRGRDPEQVDHFLRELRRAFDGARATRRRSEFARALPKLEKHLPADLWQRRFGDVDPTPVDLAVRRVSTVPGGPAGAPLTVTAEIVNQGSGAAASFTVELSIDGAVVQSVPVSGLAAGAATTVDFRPWPATPGPHTARVAADASAQIAEPVENNNTRVLRLAVRP